MIKVNKDEAAAIRAQVAGVSITRTVNHYYVEDTAPVRRVLRKLSTKGTKHA